MPDLKKERRLKRRFPIRRDLRYRFVDSPEIQGGTGTAIDASSAGIAFACDRELPLKARIEVSMSWPVTLPDSCPLRLVAQGRVVRSDGAVTAITIEKTEFRTQARPRPGTEGLFAVSASSGALSV